MRSWESREDWTMRSLIVTDSNIWTAETEYALSVATAERAMGWDVVVAAPPSSDAAEEAARELEVVRLPGSEPGRSPADLLADARFLSALVRERGFDVVHSSRSAPHVACALAVGGRAPIVHLRGGASRPSSGPLNRMLYRRMTASVVVSSGRIRRWVTERLGMPSGRVHRIFAPIDVDRFASAKGVGVRESLGIDPDARLVVNVARLAPVKGQHVLVEAMAEVVAERHDVVLVLVGEPWSGEPEAVRSLARRLGIDGSVIAAGRRSDVPQILVEADVCVSSSLGSEENSRAVSEYMAAGRPIVATAVGVVPELLDGGRNGALVEPGDPAGLASSIAELLDAPGRGAAMGERASSFAREHLSREAFREGIANVLGNIGVST